MGRLFKEMIIVGLAGVALLYLMYPSFGLFELLPDAIPLLGSLDEATATLILINTARYYGLDLTSLYGDAQKRRDTVQGSARRLPDPEARRDSRPR